LGLVGSAGHWKYQIAAFSSAGYRVLTYEHRGHGRTNNPPGRLKDYEEFADDAVALFDFLGFNRPYVAGLSDGAITALSLGMRFPEKIGPLVVAGANYYQDKAILEILGSLTPQMIRAEFPEMAAELESDMPGR
jgi:pimeloyl-ACP methyl ester carboxylesterase